MHPMKFQEGDRVIHNHQGCKNNGVKGTVIKSRKEISRHGFEESVVCYLTLDPEFQIKNHAVIYYEDELEAI